MTLYSLNHAKPEVIDPESVWLAPDSHVIGCVSIGRDVSVWFGAVIRGDNDRIVIGEGSNVQDGAVLHVDPGFPLTVGAHVTIGHRAIVHGCTIGENSLIGMGATVLNGARIGMNCLVGANALVTEGKVFPDNSLIVGAPAKVVRALTAEQIDGIRATALRYVRNGQRFRSGLSKIA